MSFPVAVQSAIFYVLACTPCTKVRHRRNAKQRAKLDREDKARREAKQPDAYRHPDPFATNPYWHEEIQIGPSWAKKGGRESESKAPSRDASRMNPADSVEMVKVPVPTPATATSSSLVGNSIEPIQEPDKEQDEGKGRASVSKSTTAVASSSTAAGDDVRLSSTLTNSTAEDWNHKRYQREDEELWGHEHLPPLSTWPAQMLDAIKHAGSTTKQYVEAKARLFERPLGNIADTHRHNFYATSYNAPLNPPVNDYHPPVVSSKPLHRDGYKWMLQPPPPAKVMEGKIPVSRSASQMSVMSRRTAVSDGGLARRMGERAFEAKIRNGEILSRELPARPKVKHSITGSTNRTRSTRAARSGSLSTSVNSADDSDAADDEEGKSHFYEVALHKGKSRRRTRQVATPPTVTGPSDEELDEDFFAFRPSLHVAQRPQLSTITSSGDFADRAGTLTPRNQSPLQEIGNLSPGSSRSPKSLMPRERLAGGERVDSVLALST